MTPQFSDAEWDRGLREMLAMCNDGLNVDDVKAVIADSLEAMRHAAAALRQGEFDPKKPTEAARAMAHAAKAIDELFRLIQFAQGQPDSRPDLGQDWLRGLTDEQLRVVRGWVDGNAERGTA